MPRSSSLGQRDRDRFGRARWLLYHFGLWLQNHWVRVSVILESLFVSKNISVVFVTGNANKLVEVRAILSAGAPIAIESRSLDRESISKTVTLGTFR